MTARRAASIARMPCVLMPATLALALAAAATTAQPESWAATYAKDVRKINEAHARKPGKTTEDALQKKLSKKARGAVEKLLAARKADALGPALVAAGEAALDLALMTDFDRIRKRLAKVSPPDAARLGTAFARPRFLLRGLGGIDQNYLESFARVLDAVLDTYDRTFGFREWSKVAGKRIRVRVRLVDRITRPPYFDPSLPFHSAIDFPVNDAEKLASPTRDGKFLFYGICHELGHLIAMWGDRRTQEDHHAWAHYTGVVVCEALTKKRKKYAFVKRLKDARWRSLELERKEHAEIAPSLADRAGVLALLIRLHDAVGAKTIGAAMNRMDEKDAGHRINHVRYYGFKDLKKALLAVVKSKKGRAKVKRLMDGV